KGRGFFKTFPDEAIRDYLIDGLRDDPSGGLKLSCSPRYEAATFAAQRHNPWHALQRAPKHIVLLRGQHHSSCPAQMSARMKEMRPDLRIATIAGATHALPMERPDRARAAIETAALMATGGVYSDLD
ncbi:MAG: alpha/beta fold hydrolase, partial [Hyphomonadaceae bacterium]